MKTELKTKILESAKRVEQGMISVRRYLHENAEVGFDMPKTSAYVKAKLSEMGIKYEECGRCGIVGEIGDARGGTILLRADMDALPLEEKTDLDYASKNGNMHACGHDLHTAMLLGSIDIISQNKELLQGRVVFMFQPAEELLLGAVDMLNGGLIEKYEPKAALMLHTLVGLPLPSGALVVPTPGVAAPSADFFEISVMGKGAHGSVPHLGINAASISAQIISAIESIPSRELQPGDGAVLTVGRVSAGTAANIIPESAVVEGSLRTYSEDARAVMKERLACVCEKIASAYRSTATVKYSGGCPTLINDKKMSDIAKDVASDLFGDMVYSAEILERGGGSEDFAYISHKIPSVMLGISAGDSREGYATFAHNPAVVYDESAMVSGAAFLAYFALTYFGEK